MEELHGKGLARNIGVCNLTVFAIMDLLSYAVVKPAVNQVSCGIVAVVVVVVVVVVV